MSLIKVKFSSLSTAAADVSGSVGTLGRILDELESDLSTLVATWDGEAAEFYRQKQRQWDTAAAELADVLRRVGGALVQAGDNYAQVETRNANLWTT